MLEVVIADDHAVVRRGLEHLLATTGDIRIVGEATTGGELLTLMWQTTCDVVLLDLGLPDLDGLEVLRQLVARYPNLPVLIFSVYDEDEFATPALQAGAAGYVSKESPPEQLLQALRLVAHGHHYLSPTMMDKLLDDALPAGRALPHHALSRREMEVLIRLSHGASLTDIGAQLYLSAKTISTYRTRLLGKLGLQSNADLTRYVMEHRLG